MSALGGTSAGTLFVYSWMQTREASYFPTSAIFRQESKHTVHISSHDHQHTAIKTFYITNIFAGGAIGLFCQYIYIEKNTVFNLLLVIAPLCLLLVTSFRHNVVHKESE